MKGDRCEICGIMDGMLRRPVNYQIPRPVRVSHLDGRCACKSCIMKENTKKRWIRDGKRKPEVECDRR